MTVMDNHEKSMKFNMCSAPNFSSLDGLEVSEKFMVGGVVWCGFQVATVSNPTNLL